jgi:NDP-sugar pyrophosphorylase family protein
MGAAKASDAPPALLLTAGLGTRLRPLTYARAKAAVPVNGEPLARRIIRWLTGYGIHDFVLNLHHRPATIASVIGDGSDLGVRARYSWEQPVLGSAGGPRHALPLLTEHGERPFLIVNGDTLTDIDINAILRTHVESRALITMAVIPNPRPDKYGGVRVAADSRVTGFTRPGSSDPSFHFIGIQVAEPRAFATLEDGLPAESVNALYPRLIAESPTNVAAFVGEGAFSDIGTPRDYLETCVALSEVEGNRLAAGANLSVAESAAIIRTALWDDVAVGAHVTLIDCIVADGVRIPDGAKYERCAIVRADGRSAAADERLDGDLLLRCW